MTTIGFFVLICIITLGLCLHFKRPLMWLFGVIPSVLLVGFGFSTSVAMWDLHFFAGFMGVSFVVVFLLMSLQTRGLEREEQEAEGPVKDDTDHYTDEAGEYKDKQNKISEATARRTSGRRR